VHGWGLVKVAVAVAVVPETCGRLVNEPFGLGLGYAAGARGFTQVV
jgi:hypothetical protein